MTTKYTYSFTCDMAAAPGTYMFVPTASAVSGGGGWYFTPASLYCRDTSGINYLPSAFSVTANAEALTISDSAILISSVLLVWSIAWVFRQVIGQITNRR